MTERHNAHRFLLRQNDAAVGQAATRDEANAEARTLAARNNAEVFICDASKKIDGVGYRAIATVFPGGKITEIIFE